MYSEFPIKIFHDTLFPLLMSQHGEAVQYAAGAETKICGFLWGEGEEGESSQPHDEDDGSGGRILIKTDILTMISQFIFLIFTIMMWPEDKLDMDLTQHLSMLFLDTDPNGDKLKERTHLSFQWGISPSQALRIASLLCTQWMDCFFFFFVCCVKKKVHCFTVLLDVWRYFAPINPHKH